MENAKKLCMELLKAEDENKVTKILEDRALLSDNSNWRNYGDVPNNFGIISNQQSDSIASLVEKIVNSIDAMLMKESLLRGQNPETDESPVDMFKASEEFFDIPNGKIAKLYDQEKKRDLAGNIQIVATGERNSPNFTIIDKGEGQHPDKLPKTILSLNQNNKNKVSFVQGRFNMGGTGVLPFCGEKGYQLVICKRHPDLLEGKSSNTWGFTIIRRRPPERGEKTPVYEYLAPNGEIPRFNENTLPLKAEDGESYKGEMEWGTCIKLYEYDITPQTMVTTNLYRRLNQRLFYLPLPFTLHETRDYKGKTMYSIVEGMRARLETSKFRDRVLEKDDFPIDSEVKITDDSHARVKIWLLKPDVDVSRWIRASEAICFTINGQTHSSWDRGFFGRNSVKKGYIKNHLLVEVDCSQFDSQLINSMFMGSRDRMRELPEKKKLENVLEDTIKNDDLLKQYNQGRREEKIKDRLEESEETEEIFREFINKSPEIANLLGGNGTLPDPFKMGPEEETYEGNRFPSFFNLVRPESKEMEVPVNSYRRVVFETDVVNDFFSRIHEPGNLIIESKEWLKGRQLRNGKLTITVEPPENSSVGDCAVLDVKVESPNKIDPFEESIFVEVGPKQKKSKNPAGKNKETSSGVDVPPINEVYKEDWKLNNRDWDENSVAEVTFHEEGTDISVNMDNINLQRALRNRSNRKKEESIKYLYKIGIGTMAFAMKNQIGNEVSEDLWHEMMKPISMAWLPSVLTLSDIVDL